MLRQQQNAMSSSLAKRNFGTSQQHADSCQLLQTASTRMPRTRGARDRDERTPLLCSTGGGASESLAKTSVVVTGDIRQGVSWAMATFLLVNTALGAGMLNYPYAYNQAGGVWQATLLQIVSLSLISRKVNTLLAAQLSNLPANSLSLWAASADLHNKHNVHSCLLCRLQPRQHLPRRAPFDVRQKSPAAFGAKHPFDLLRNQHNLSSHHRRPI